MRYLVILFLLIGFNQLAAQEQIGESSGRQEEAESRQISVLIVDQCELVPAGFILNKKRREVLAEMCRDYFTAMEASLLKAPNVELSRDSLLPRGFISNQLTEQMQAAALDYALVFNLFESGFWQSEVIVDKDWEGTKTRTAVYQVFCKTHVDIYNRDGILLSRDVTNTAYHSERTVLSGLLARGPSYEANKKAIGDMARSNLEETLALVIATIKPTPHPQKRIDEEELLILEPGLPE
ncbi:hypothetical protein [Gaoshiqia sp. Z1-71]|uniref:hypothetical protein n=1 Tax=Gaoshiqia hydrogeniformans TaxID=3290090 RepID=UPI003BF86C30